MIQLTCCHPFVAWSFSSPDLPPLGATKFWGLENSLKPCWRYHKNKMWGRKTWLGFPSTISLRDHWYTVIVPIFVKSQVRLHPHPQKPDPSNFQPESLQSLLSLLLLLVLLTCHKKVTFFCGEKNHLPQLDLEIGDSNIYFSGESMVFMPHPRYDPILILCYVFRESIPNETKPQGESLAV